MHEIRALSAELKRNVSDIATADNSEKAKFAFAELKINVENAFNIASRMRDTDKLRADMLIIEAKRAMITGINAMAERPGTEAEPFEEKEKKQEPRRKFSFFRLFGKKINYNAITKHNTHKQ